MLLLLKFIGDIWIYAQSPNGLGPMSIETMRVRMWLQLIFDVSVLWLPPRVGHSFLVNILKTLLEEKSSMMCYVSHELRTPLNINMLSVNFVKTEIKMLKADLGPQRAVAIADALGDMEVSCTTALSLVDDFLTFD